MSGKRLRLAQGRRLTKGGPARDGRAMLTVETADGVAVVTLNRPEAMNALSKALRLALHEALVQCERDDAVRAIVLTGAGRAFTAGLDLKELAASPEGMKAANATTPQENPALAVLACAKPVVGAINGVAITGGFELALACDVLIASSAARFADTHVRVGILPGWGLSQRLSRLVGIYRAKELSLTGNFLDAQTAQAWGLVNRVVEPDELLPTAKALAADIASVPPETAMAYKQLIDEGFALPFGEALAHEAAVSTPYNGAVTPETVERNRAAVQARGRKQ